MKKLLIILLLFFSGCAKDTLSVTYPDGKKVKVDITYILQDKQFKKLSYNPATNNIEIEGFMSETAEVLSELKALLGVVE